MLPTPALKRRMAAFLYEGVLLFAVVALVGTVYSLSTGQHHGLQGRSGQMVAQFLGLALYFLWFWSHGGQTLAMKTWHIRLQSARSGPMSLQQALMRYMLSWLWFIPPLLGTWAAGRHHTTPVYAAAVCSWIVAYALLTRVLPDRQFLHDVLSGTRLVDTRTT